MVGSVSAFEKNRTVESCKKLPACVFHGTVIIDEKSGQNLSLRDIRCDELCQREKFCLECFFGFRFHQTMSACRHHDRIQDNMFRFVLAEFGSNTFHSLRGRKHADLDGIRENIRKYGIHLCGDKISRCFQNPIYSGSVLGSQGSDHTGSVDTVHGDRLDIRLNACAAAGIASCDSQYCFLFHSGSPPVANNFFINERKKIFSARSYP